MSLTVPVTSWTDNVGGKVRPINYDFAVQGGAVGDIALDLVIPQHVVITGGVLRVATTLASSGSATVALKVNSNGDLLTATAFATLNSAGTFRLLSGTVDATAASATQPLVVPTVTTTAVRTLTLQIGTAALTAGKIVIVLDAYDTRD